MVLWQESNAVRKSCMAIGRGRTLSGGRSWIDVSKAVVSDASQGVNVPSKIQNAFDIDRD